MKRFSPRLDVVALLIVSLVFVAGFRTPETALPLDDGFFDRAVLPFLPTRHNFQDGTSWDRELTRFHAREKFERLRGIGLLKTRGDGYDFLLAAGVTHRANANFPRAEDVAMTVRAVNHAIEKGAQVTLDARDGGIHLPFGYYPLADAVIYGGMPEVVEILLKAGATPDHQGGRGFIHELGDAARRGPGEENLKIVELLLRYGADPNGGLAWNTRNPAESPVKAALRTGFTAAVKLLLEHGASQAAADQEAELIRQESATRADNNAGYSLELKYRADSYRRDLITSPWDGSVDLGGTRGLSVRRARIAQASIANPGETVAHASYPANTRQGQAYLAMRRTCARLLNGKRL